MIKRLRNRFIRIAMLSVTAVMMLLTIILNVANYVSTDSDLKQTLTLIYENAGTIPHSRFLPPSGSDSADAPTPPENDGGSGDTAPTARTIHRRRRPRPTTKSRGVRGRSRRKRRSPRVFLSCTTHQAAR